MKKLLLIALSLSFAWHSASAQDMTDAEVDSLEYIMPSFSIGTVLFQNGERSQALLNINTFDNAIRFIDENKDTLIVKNEEDVKSVYIKNRYFAKWQRKYVELLNPTNDTSIGIHRYINAIPKKNVVGAYGMASETASVSNLSHISDNTGSTYKLKQRGKFELSYHEDLYICKGARIYPANTRGFQKVYPKLKNQIAQFVKDNDIDFRSLDSIQLLYNFCIKNQ